MPERKILAGVKLNKNLNYRIEPMLEDSNLFCDREMESLTNTGFLRLKSPNIGIEVRYIQANIFIFQISLTSVMFSYSYQSLLR